MKDCLFCKIVEKEIPSDFIFEDDRVVAFNDISPQAPTHILIIPKEHFNSLMDIPDDKLDIISHIHNVARKLAQDRKIDGSGFRVVNNCGKEGGQSVGHLHYHLLGGRQLAWPPG
ncbi:MAG TPA: histidine triad nucleotide-binding protein [Eubacteriaceae bacterium]|nr:histidine triad nucleotide-binding protein [Eubacteriaceae bacterium]